MADNRRPIAPLPIITKNLRETVCHVSSTFLTEKPAYSVTSNAPQASISGCPAKKARAKSAARTAKLEIFCFSISRSAPQRSQGIMEAVVDGLILFADDSRGPDMEKIIAPSAAAGIATWRFRKRNVP